MFVRSIQSLNNSCKIKDIKIVESYCCIFFIDIRCELQASRVVVLDNGKKMLYTSIHMPKSFIIAVCSLINEKLTVRDKLFSQYDTVF